MRSSRLRGLGIGAALIVSAGMALGQNGIMQAPLGAGGTWNVYQMDWTGRNFSQSVANAASQVDPSGTALVFGHPVAVSSQTENDFVWRLGDRGDIWIGLTDREGAAPGAQESRTMANPLTMGWAWVNGDPFTFQNWPASGEPNDWGAGYDVGGEDAGHIRHDGRWNDNGTAYALNSPIVPVLQPGTSGAEGSPTMKTAIEWDVQSPTPIAGVRRANIFADLQATSPLPGPAGGSGFWGVREIRGVSPGGNVYNAVDLARSGSGTITDGSFNVLDTADPETNPNPAGSVPGYANAYLTDTTGNPAGEGDNDITTIAHGKVRIPTAGQYTFQVRSDDGFAFRIPGQNILQVYGPDAAGIDPLDPQTAFFRNGTGDADTRIAYNLAAGDYDVEFINWEGGGGAYYEVSSAQGNIGSSANANWIRVGDSATSYAPQFVPDPATLTGNVTWYKVDVASAGTLATAISTMDAAVAGSTYNYTGTHGDTYIDENDHGGQDDHYYLRVDGGFTVDDRDATPGETFTVTFALRTDDGSAIHILGQNFTAFGGISGQSWAFGTDTGLGADVWTGDAQGLGQISLTEGVTYNFESYLFEGSGGSDYDIQIALGAYTGVGDPGATWYTLDLSDNTINRPANIGLALVPEPATGLMALLGLALLAGLRRAK